MQGTPGDSADKTESCEARFRQRQGRDDSSSRPRQERVLLWVIWTAVPLGIVIFYLQIMFHLIAGPVAEVVGLVICGGLIALGLAALWAYLSRKMTRSLDVFRILCWTVVGSGVGSCSFGKGYFFYWPDHRDLALNLTGAAIHGGVLLIIVVSIGS